MSVRLLRRLEPGARARLRRWLEAPRYELLPGPGSERAAGDLPAESAVTVTSSPDLGMAPTVDLSVRLAVAGHRVIPHLAARYFPDDASLDEQLARLGESGIVRALVVAGVGEEHGPFPDSLALIDALAERGSPFEIGIAAYPEGHPDFTDESLAEALQAKAPHAVSATTQMTFRATSVTHWIDSRTGPSAGLEVWVGVPGIAGMPGLAGFAASGGLSRALTFAYQHPRLVAGVLRPGDRRSTRLVADLAAGSADIAGLHFYTFNQVAKTERWRRRLLHRLG